MSHDHHQHVQSKNKLLAVFILTAGFLVVELIAAYWTQSLALLTDAGHMFTDVLALGIALTAATISHRSADSKRTYGYYRVEVLAAVFNAILLALLALYVLFHAISRLSEASTIYSQGMIIIGLLGLLVNMIGLSILSHPHEHNMNIRAARLEVLADLVASLGVLLAGIIIYFTHWLWVDSAVAIAIALWMIPRVYRLLKEGLHVLLEGVPHHIDLEAIRQKILTIEGITDIHDLHVWSLTPQQITLTVHLVCPLRHSQEVLEAAMQLLSSEFGIHHVSIQCEQKPCAMARSEAEHYTPSSHG